MRLSLLAFVFIAACASRPLTETERAFTETIHGATLTADSVRIVKGAVVGVLRPEIPVRPRTTCREKLVPPRIRPGQGRFPAMAGFNTLFYSRPFHAPDFLPAYPERIDIVEAMRLAHEMTHIWQWQNRQITGYHPIKAGREHAVKSDPYLIDANTEISFLDYGYEQQGVIVEEFVCCRALDPDGARTERLHAMLKKVFPDIRRRESAKKVNIPFPDQTPKGLCR